MPSRLSPTERPHPLGADLEKLPLRTLVARLHRGDGEAVRAVARALPSLSRLAALLGDALASGGRLFYLGAGTSGRLCALDAAEHPPTFGTRPSQVVALVAGGSRALSRSVEGAEDRRGDAVKAVRRARIDAEDVVVGVTASGTTPFVLAGLAEARRRGAATAFITSNPRARPRCDHRVLLATGPELLAGSTRLKAGSATKMALSILSTAAMARAGRVWSGRMIDFAPTNAKLRARAVRMVAELAKVSAPAARRALMSARWSARRALDVLGVEV
jgi:N-acetylmuramic acid 6-phosphate etherase